MSQALRDLAAAGVAVWLDDLSRDRLRTGNLQQLIDEAKAPCWAPDPKSDGPCRVA